MAAVGGAMLLEALASPAQDPLKLLPKNYQKIFENSDVTVIHAHYGPHETIAVHDHASFTTVFVYLSDSGPVRIDHQDVDGTVVPVTRPPTVAGSYRIAPGIAERHSIENPGDASSDFLRIELKRLVLSLNEPFRGRAPQSLAADADTVEFTNPQLEVERIVCVEASPCLVKPSVAPSLIVAFTAVSIDQNEKLKPGAVKWLQTAESKTVRADGVGPVHLLRILLLESPK